MTYDGYLITGSSDSTVKVWTVDPKDGAGTLIILYYNPDLLNRVQDRIREKQTIALGARYPLAVQVARLPRSNGSFQISMHHIPTNT